MEKNTEQTQPLVSVIMPVYNAAGFLASAIESILGQTYQNFELIIVNDASTDDSGKIIEMYRRRYPEKIQVISLQRNLNRGGDSCANTALEQATGKYIARMDADDIAHPERLEKQVQFLEEQPDIFLVGSNAHVVDGTGVIIGDKLEPLTSIDIYRSYFTFHPIIHPSATYRRIVNGKPFAYSVKFSANNDYYTFFKLLCKGEKFANLPEKLLFYRIHQTNDTFVHIKRKFMNTLKVRIEMFLKYRYEPTLKQVLTTVLQALVMFFLPERVTKKLYLISKGIIKVRNPFSLLKTALTINSLKSRVVMRRFASQKLG
jgi:glycosyltransferase involved in cell wall biosynthesis